MYDVNKWQELYQPHTDYQISKFNVTDLPDKYNIDLNRLDEGIKNTLQNFQMIPYTVDAGKAGVIKVPGYYGLCFKCKKASIEPLSEGLSSNVHTHSNKNEQIDLEYTEKTPAWFDYLDEVVSKFRGNVTQIRLIKLEAGHNLLSREQTSHLDYPWYRGIRLHLCITPGVDYVWRVLGEDYHFERSEKLRYLDVGKPHGAVNQHNEVDRFVLNINLAPKLDLHIDEQIEKQII